MFSQLCMNNGPTCVDNECKFSTWRELLDLEGEERELPSCPGFNLMINYARACNRPTCVDNECKFSTW